MNKFNKNEVYNKLFYDNFTGITFIILFLEKIFIAQT